jgi:hypothetical protein
MASAIAICAQTLDAALGSRGSPTEGDPIAPMQAQLRDRLRGCGVDVRTLQQWMGQASVATTEIYMAYAPRPHEAAMVSRAFRVSEAA